MTYKYTKKIEKEIQITYQIVQISYVYNAVPIYTGASKKLQLQSKQITLRPTM
jgi:hypothetical protein